MRFAAAAPRAAAQAPAEEPRRREAPEDGVRCVAAAQRERPRACARPEGQLAAHVAEAQSAQLTDRATSCKSDKNACSIRCLWVLYPLSYFSLNFLFLISFSYVFCVVLHRTKSSASSANKLGSKSK